MSFAFSFFKSAIISSSVFVVVVVVVVTFAANCYGSAIILWFFHNFLFSTRSISLLTIRLQLLIVETLISPLLAFRIPPEVSSFFVGIVDTFLVSLYLVCMISIFYLIQFDVFLVFFYYSFFFYILFPKKAHYQQEYLIYGFSSSFFICLLLLLFPRSQRYRWCRQCCYFLYYQSSK